MKKAVKITRKNKKVKNNKKKHRAKINRRNQDKFSALKPHYNLKTRYEELDYDYLDKLTDEEKDWLARFTEEYTHANFNHPGKKIHKTKQQRREIYSRNNARNRDILTRAKACGKQVHFEDTRQDELVFNGEEGLIKKFDKKL